MIYAICDIERKGNTVGARLLNMTSGTIINMANDKIVNYINNGNKIRNLEVVNNKVSWVQGSKDRYPVICADTLNIIKNRDSLTVLGYRNDIDNIGKQIYILANYLGQTAELNEERLINYVGQYGLTNCKLVERKGGIKFIASIAGELHYIETKVDWEYNNYNNELICNLPPVTINKLEIPTRAKGIRVIHPMTMYVTPEIRARSIHYIKIPNGIEYVSGELFEPFTRLKTINIDTKLKRFINTLMDNHMLEEFRLKDYEDGILPDKMFKGLSSLKRVILPENIVHLGREAFSGCTNLSIQSILREGILKISDRTFSECNDTEIVLPESLRVLHKNAFDDCNNLRKIVIQSQTLDIEAGGGDRKTELGLESCGPVDIYVPYGLDIQRYFASNVRVHQGKPTSKDIKAEKIEKKAAVLGIDVEAHQKPESDTEMLGILKSLSDKQWDDIIKQILINMRNNVRGSIIVGVDGFKFEANISNRYSNDEVRKIDVSEKYALVWLKGNLKVLVIDRQLNIELLEEKINSWGVRRNDKYIFVLPNNNLKNSSVNPIKSVGLNERGQVEIERKYGNKIETVTRFMAH